METGKEAILLKLDLSDLNSVKSAADEFLRYACALDHGPLEAETIALTTVMRIT